MNKSDRLIDILFKIVISIEIIVLMILIIANITTPRGKLKQKSFYENKKINELIPVSPTDELVAKKYFSDFVNLTFYNPEIAYEHLADYYKKKVYPSYDYFKKNIMNDVTEGFKTASVSSYKVTEKSKYRVIYIKDSSNHEYLIREDGIMNYKIYLDINNVDI